MLSVVAKTQTLAPSVIRYDDDDAAEDHRSSAPSAISMLLAALEEIDYGLLVIDPISHRLHHANRLALTECRAGGSLTLEHGRVHARGVACRQPLEKALLMVLSDKRSLVSLEGDRGRSSVAVVPLADAGGRLALLMFGKQEVCEPLSVSFFARLHALTPSECGVLKALCRGLRPADIAKETGVAISTVRTQVSSIRMKTRTTSIHELVRTMAALPPINPVLRMVCSAN